MHSRLAAAAAVAVVVLGSGCAFMNPRSSERSHARWETFEDVRAAVEAIGPGETTAAELAALGFDPASGGVARHTGSELAHGLIKNTGLQLDQLPLPVQHCLARLDRCVVLEIDLERETSARHGIFVLDWLNFHRVERANAWWFKATLVVVDDLVVFRLWSGSGETGRQSVELNPLGPFQSVPSVWGWLEHW